MAKSLPEQKRADSKYSILSDNHPHKQWLLRPMHGTLFLKHHRTPSDNKHSTHNGGSLLSQITSTKKKRLKNSVARHLFPRCVGDSNARRAKPNTLEIKYTLFGNPFPLVSSAQRHRWRVSQRDFVCAGDGGSLLTQITSTKKATEKFSRSPSFSAVRRGLERPQGEAEYP